MRIHGAAIGAAGLILWFGMTSALGQTVPSAGINALDQTMPDSSSLPATGLTLEWPSALEPVRENDETQPRPSDGLGLQIYGSGTSVPGENAGETLWGNPGR